eukprot:scaffold49170_cov19-Tisochrysis_lutea.AAC.1
MQQLVLGALLGYQQQLLLLLQKGDLLLCQGEGGAANPLADRPRPQTTAARGPAKGSSCMMRRRRLAGIDVAIDTQLKVRS